MSSIVFYDRSVSTITTERVFLRAGEGSTKNVNAHNCDAKN